MAKVDAKGQSKGSPYVKLHRGVTGSAAWRSLSCQAKGLLIEIWTFHNGFNNGAISYSIRQAMSALHIGSTKAAGAFKELQDKGFLIERKGANFGWKTGAGKGHAREWELTTEPCDNQPPKACYRDYKIQNAVSQTRPFGISGKTVGTKCTPKTPLTVSQARPISPISTPKRSCPGYTSIMPYRRVN